MVHSKDSTAPLIAVVGATGQQGGSVIQALLASPKPYRIRGLSRDISKPAAQALLAHGVELFQVTIAVGQEAEVRRAFEGAEYVFAVTDYWSHMSKDREIAEGKLMADAAKAVGVKLFLWSGLQSISALSNGKYTHVEHFDSKAIITAYAREQLPTISVEAGGYFQNFASIFKAKPQPDGSYVIALPAPAHMQLPSLDIRDYGLFVRAAIETDAYKPGDQVLASTVNLTFQEIVDELSAATGKTFRFDHVDDDTFRKASEMPEFVIVNMLDLWHAFTEVRSNRDLAPGLKNLAREPKGWVEWVKETDPASFL